MKYASLVLLLALLPGLAGAQDVSVQGVVSETTVGLEEAVAFTLEVQGASFSEIETPEAPETEGLVLQNPYPSTQRNISFINGELSQSVAYQWSFRPVRTGTAAIRPLTVVIDGRTYTTEAIRVSVVPQAQRPAQRGFTRRPFGAPPGTRPADDDRAAEAIGESDLFIRVIPSKRTAYQNEQVTLEYQLFFRDAVQPRHSRLADSWDAEGFWREELDVEARPMPRTVVENGLRYHSIVLKRVAVFPTRPGRLTIDPLRIETEVFASRGARDPFGGLLSMTNPYATLERASPAVAIEARPLPDGAPEMFQGAVGQFSMTARLNRTTAEVGEPLQLEVAITGTGNVAMIEPLPLQAPGVFEVYEPETETDLQTGGRAVRGTRRFTYLLVPRSNGTFTLPPVTFAYFDPGAEAFRTLRSAPMTVRVSGTAAPVESGTVASGLPVDDVAPLFREAAWHAAGTRPLHRRPWVYGVLALPLLLLAALLLYRRRLDHLAANPGEARQRQAHPLARRHLQRADALRHEGEPRAFFAELERAVLGFIGNRLNVAERGLTRPDLEARLAAAGVGSGLCEDVHRLLDLCDRGRFAPTPPPPERLDEALGAAQHLIVALDAALVAPASARS